MKRGFTKAWRKELDSPIWMMPPLYLKVWYFLRHRVQRDPYLFPTHKSMGIWVLPGQRLTSLQEIAEGVKWSEWGREVIPNKKTIKTILDWMVNEGMINVESNGKGTLITIINWDTYNHVGNEESNGQETARKRPADTRKELKELEEVVNYEDKKTRVYPPQKIQFAKHVNMTQDEYDKLVSKHGEAKTLAMIEKLDAFKGSKGKTYKDDYRAILSWVVDAMNKNQPPRPTTPGGVAL